MQAIPKLSVVVPVYNTSKYLRRCLDSILAQSYHNLEIIVVNDCSTDNSSEIISEYCHSDSRVTSVSHPQNRGLFQARLTGAECASGEYIAFVDSDDYLSLDFYRELIQCAVNDGCDIVAGNTIRDLGNDVLSQYTLHKLCFGDEKLCGEEVRDRFYAQEGSCYAWHTMWNKVYSKKLWDLCVPEYRKITKHLIMTEDVAFSSVMFYHAQSFRYVGNDSNGYFYCANMEASTNTQNISFGKFRKNLQDLNLVFNFVDAFHMSVDAKPEIRSHFRNFRMRYYQMWKRLQENEFVLGEHAAEAKALVEELGAGETDKQDVTFRSFEALESKWYPQIEEIKKLISREDIAVISFDIFDTLLLRPFWAPDDLFVLMQNQFEQICPEYRNNSFRSMRLAAENRARSEIRHTNAKYQDVTLDEVYREMQKEFQLSQESVSKLQALEEEMELAFSRERKTAKLLFEFARACGKRIILVSDMYLKAESIEAMLHKNGFAGYEKLFLSSRERVTKYSGKLFDQVLSELGLAPQHILHIGDNWEHDICMAKSKGFQTAFLPKARDRFCNTVGAAPTNSLAAIGCLVGGHLTTWNKLMASVGYRSMLALAANKFFDNPYASWNPCTDFDANPYAMGYYAVGMHLVGITKWLVDVTKERGINHICFLARDGYLPMMAFERLKVYFDAQNTTLEYVPCSRKCVMPWIIESEQGLYSLPIEFRNHTPLSVLELLEKYIPAHTKEELRDQVQNAGFEPDSRFVEEKKYILFINWVKDNLFSTYLLEKEKQNTSAYYQKMIPEGSLVFDLGYSGRILAALQNAVQYPVTFAYVHEDGKDFQAYCRRGKLDTDVMYDHIPPYSDLIREYFLSEVGNACVGLEEENGAIVPRYADTDPLYDECYVPQKITEGACQFVADFVDAFSSVKDALYFNPVCVSMPFEGLLQASTLADRNVLSLCYSDDTVYGQNDRISMAHFWCSQVYSRSVREASDGQANLEMMLLNKGKLSKAIVYWICDRGTLKEKVKTKLAAHPTVLFGMRKTYGFFKKIWNKLKGR